MKSLINLGVKSLRQNATDTWNNLTIWLTLNIGSQYENIIIKVLKKVKNYGVFQRIFLPLQRVSPVRPAPAESPQVRKEARVGG
jgi:hypothetical protein